MTNFTAYLAHLATLGTMPDMDAEVATRRKVCADFDELLTRMRQGEDVAVNWTVIEDARTKLRLAERAQRAVVAGQLRTLDETHYQLVCPWWAPSEVKRG